MAAQPVSPPVLRWEWRTFAPDLGDVKRRLPSLAHIKAEHSRETYIVCALVPHSAQVRFDELDVRRLVQLDAQGLQQWDPVIKTTFPIAAETAARLFGIWRLPLPGFERPHYSVTLFLEDVVARNRDLHVVEVEKTRYGFVYEGCAAELTQVTVNGIPLESLSLEHEHESVLLGAMDDLGFVGTRNVSYAQAIKDVLGLTMLPATV